MAQTERISKRLLVVPALVGILFILTGAVTVHAQNPPPPSGPQAAPETTTFTADQLNDMVAPIALYPDGLLSQVLVASTYPLEIVEAQQWLKENSSLTGTQLTDAAKQQTWDASVQALVPFPDVLTLLNQDIRWTRDLGNAFLAQEGDVLAAVQRLRTSAQANGRLTSSAQQTVSTETQGDTSAIVIQPTNPDVIYVPSYDPNYIWGAPLWGYYPALYYPAFGFGWGYPINLSYCFGGWGGWNSWGWGPNWHGHNVYVNNNFFHRYAFNGVRNTGVNRTTWAHDPGHRLGIPYPNRQLNGRYGAASIASRPNMNMPGRQGNMMPGMMPGRQGNMPNAGARPGNMPNMTRPAMPMNPGVPPGISPNRGGAARSMPDSPSRPMQAMPQNRPMPPMPHNNPGFGGGGFGGGGMRFPSGGGVGHPMGGMGGGRPMGGGGMGGHGGRR